MSKSRRIEFQIGQKIGQLVVVGEMSTTTLGPRKRTRRKIKLECSCGKRVFADPSHLAAGSYISCGCNRPERNQKLFKKHGCPPEYGLWFNIKRRCLDPSNPGYKNYGGRGIKLCRRWTKFENFLEDMGSRPPGKTIERKNNNGNYTPSNCVWATRQEQARNKRNNRVIKYQGKWYHLQGLADACGVDRNTLATRLNAGWSIEKAVRPGKQRYKPTHCPQGHEYTQENTVVKMRSGYPCRSCRECAREKCRRYQRRLRETDWIPCVQIEKE